MERGTGFSKPNLTCIDRLALPLNVAPTREAAIKDLRANARDCAFYWHNVQRVDLTAYNTNESADDLEDLRKALGANQISLWSGGGVTGVLKSMERALWVAVDWLGQLVA